jgi:hypothetical protein
MLEHPCREAEVVHNHLEDVEVNMRGYRDALLLHVARDRVLSSKEWCRMKSAMYWVTFLSTMSLRTVLVYSQGDERRE